MLSPNLLPLENFLWAWEAVGLPVTMSLWFLFISSGILIFVFRVLFSFYYIDTLSVCFPSSFIFFLLSLLGLILSLECLVGLFIMSGARLSGSMLK